MKPIFNCNFPNKPKLRLGLFCLFSLCFLAVTYAQKQSDRVLTYRFSGKVLDIQGEPIIGANVIVDGTSRGTITNTEGYFNITFSNSSQPTISIRYIGMKEKKIILKKQEVNMDVIMEEETNTLSDVVVTGYQTISKERATGSFDIIRQKDMDSPSVNIGKSLLGKIPGLAANQSADGQVTGFVIRGQGGLLTNTAPLLVVDGFPIEGGLNSINPNDVESISVLKDAAAASIWGARASNGVIVVTTKKAKDKKLTIEVSSQIKIGSKVDLDYLRNAASSEEMVNYEQSLFGKYGIKEFGSKTDFTNFKSAINHTYSQVGILRNKHLYGEISDQEFNAELERLKHLDNSRQLEKAFYQQPIYQQYNLSIHGGTDRMKNFVSLMYSHNDPLSKRTSTENWQFNYRGNMQVFKWLDLSISSYLRYSKDEGTEAIDIKKFAPYDMLYNPDGSYADLSHLKFYTPMVDAMVPKHLFPYQDWSYKPIDEINNTSKVNKSINARFQVGLNVNLMKGLTFETKLQYERIQTDYKTLHNDNTFYVRNKINTTTSWAGADDKISQNLPSGSIIDLSQSLKESFNFRNQINFNRIIAEKHAINAIAGLEISQLKSNSTDYAPTYGYDADHLTVGIFPNGTKDLKAWTGNELTINYINKFGYHLNRYFSAYSNLAYTYDDKYSVSASVRTDASNFITDDPKYKYSPFWSVGLSWNLMNENFMKSYHFIDFLKPRITYGSNGNADSSTSVIPLIHLNGFNQISGDLEASIWSKGNPSLRWERTNTLNLGFDYSLFNRKLYGKIDFYTKQGYDILGDVSIPMINGATSAVFNNAEISNIGFEALVGSDLAITKDLKWSGSLTFGYNKNKVTKLTSTSVPYWWLSGEGVSGNFFVEGKPIGQVYSYIYGGVKNVGTEISPKYLPTVKLNDQEYMPFGGSTSYNGLDFMAYQGTTIAPINAGMTHSFSYKNFDLSITFTGKFGHVFRRTGFNYVSNYQIPNAQLKEIINADPEKIVPMPIQENDNLSSWSKAQYMSYLTCSASHVRLQELQLSYNLPSGPLSKLGIGRATLYFQGNNLLTFKSIDEDPEFQYGTMPLQPSYTFGFKCNF